MANGCIRPWGIGPHRPCIRAEGKAPASFERAKKRRSHQEALNLTYVGRKLVLTMGYTSLIPRVTLACHWPIVIRKNISRVDLLSIIWAGRHEA